MEPDLRVEINRQLEAIRMDPKKREAEALCGLINTILGWEAAEPQFCRVHNRYTGSVVLRRRGAEQLQVLLMLDHAFRIEPLVPVWMPVAAEPGVTAFLRL
ncbi:MAG TPA: hypothetical protein VN817_06905 [Solirubrobacteraceae bacterium]|nr:hypothetical protein [Solirubrobacteraceae bacterium]